MAAWGGLAQGRLDDARRHREDRHRVRPARPRRRRLPDRHQVEDGPRHGRATSKYIVCNADEGDSGTFADRMIMEGDPFVLIEGMAIAGIATGATKGYIYIRSEYPHAIAAMNAAIEARGKRGVLGAPCSARPNAFDMEVRVGAGAYVCGEETSLLKASKASAAWCAPSRRCRPPGSVRQADGHQQRHLARLRARHSRQGRRRHYRDFGMGRSRGTMPIQLAGNVKHGGLFEAGFGMTLGEIVDEIGGGTATGRPVKAVQVGGPLGAYFPRELFDTPFDYEAFAAKDGLIGHAGITVFDDTADMAQAGALRDGVLRHRELRQVHALPYRFDARRRDDRQDRRRRSSRKRTSRSSPTSATR
jgi:formate dehydrogenase iron-sulfur subunit